MTQKEKAKELVVRFKHSAYSDYLTTDKEYANAKQCALIAVDEMINILVMVFDNNDTNSESYEFMDKRISYLEEVKQEIEKL